MVQQEEFERADLGLVSLVAGVLGLHHHAGSDGCGARGHEFALSLDLHVALSARPGGFQVGVVAEPGDLDAQLLGGPDEQRPLADGDLLRVDAEGGELRAHSSTSEME